MRFRLLFLIISMIVIIGRGNVVAQMVRLTWSASLHPNIGQYGIYRATHPDSGFQRIGLVQHPDTTFADSKMEWGKRYFYVATSIDKAGKESHFSNMIDTLLSTNTPVELFSFVSSVQNDDVILDWYTASEINNYGFELQRCEKMADDFKTIGFVPSQGSITSPRHYRYIDKHVAEGQHYYRLKQIDCDGTFEFSDTLEVNVGVSRQFSLYQNHPNPFNSATTISFHLPEAGKVELIVYNISGQEVIRLVDGFLSSGSHKADWDGKNSEGQAVGSGIYYYKLNTPTDSQLRRMVLLR